MTRYARGSSPERLHDRELVVAPELQVTVDDLVDRVPAPAEVIGRRQCANMPPPHSSVNITLVLAVRERRAVPVRVDRIGHSVDPHRVGRIGDVDQQSVPLARPSGELERREDRDVATRSGFGANRRNQSFSGGRVLRRLRGILEPVQRTRLLVPEQPRLADDRSRRGVRERNLDHLDTPQRRIRGLGA